MPHNTSLEPPNGLVSCAKTFSHFSHTRSESNTAEIRAYVTGLMQAKRRAKNMERTFRDAKSEVEMADYQTRGWLTWHHHIGLVMLAMLFLTREKMHTAAIRTPECGINITSGDITFMLGRRLPQRAQGRPVEEEVRRMLEKRLASPERDQVRRRSKTRKGRPPLWPDEHPNQMTAPNLRAFGRVVREEEV